MKEISTTTVEIQLTWRSWMPIGQKGDGLCVCAAQRLLKKNETFH